MPSAARRVGKRLDPYLQPVFECEPDHGVVELHQGGLSLGQRWPVDHNHAIPGLAWKRVGEMVALADRQVTKSAGSVVGLPDVEQSPLRSDAVDR